MKNYDYIIAGGGASGLLLAYRMINDPFFNDKEILIIDKVKKTGNDRTWCFWEVPGGVFDDLLFKTWDNAIFKSSSASLSFSLHPFQYKMIRSKEFYYFMHNAITTCAHITTITDSVVAVKEESNHVVVKTIKGTYCAKKVFNSIFNKDMLYKQQRYPILQQHFKGWFIKSDTEVFDNSTITFMDFTVPQQGNTRFMYVLPYSKTEALLEYTLFSEQLLSEEAYENAIKTYIKELGITHYEVVEKESGRIPMTCYNFNKHHSENIIYIGTAGGWTKPSTGYTFLNTVKQTQYLITGLKKGDSLTRVKKKNRFWYYDLLFLDVLYRRNELGSRIFSAIFNHNPPQRVFKFLEEQTTFLDDLKIITSLPPYPFLKSLFRRLFSNRSIH